MQLEPAKTNLRIHWEKKVVLSWNCNLIADITVIGYFHKVNNKEHVQQFSSIFGYCGPDNSVRTKWDQYETPNGMEQCGDNDSPQLISWV
jgi:hypothetical protein